MPRRKEFGELLVELLTAAEDVPVHIQFLYQLVERQRPDLVDDEPDPHAPDRPKWQHDLRWELQTAVLAGRIRKRNDVGLGYYSSAHGNAHALHQAGPIVRLAPIERFSPEAIDLLPSSDPRQVQPEEALLVERYARWSHQEGRTLGRIEFRTCDGERLVADLYDPQRHLIIEAKASAQRSAIRLAIGQLFDYRFMFQTRPSIAVLLPSLPSRTAQELLQECVVGLIVERDRGDFTELFWTDQPRSSQRGA